jgi:hypothetical protein
MRGLVVRLACFAAIAATTASCYFLSDFDNLQGGLATSSATEEGGGGSSTTSVASSGTTSASTSTTDLGGSGGTGGGSGSTSTCPPPGADYTGLVMNELAPKGLPDDWIELRNNGAAAIPLCGVFLTQDYDDITIPSGPDRFTFGDVYLAPGKYMVVASGAELPFGLSKDAPERITLFAPDGKVLDDTSWTATPSTEFTPYESWGRIPDGTGSWKRVNNPTKGTSNFELGGSGGAGVGGSAPDAGGGA